MKSPFILLALVTTFFLTATEVRAVGPNIVPNNSLSIPSSTTPAEPDSWFPDYFGILTPTFSYPVTGHTGQAVSVSITNYQRGDAKWFFTPQTVTKGHVYSFSDYYLSTAQTRVIVQFTTTSGQFSYLVLGNPPASNTWKQFTASFTIPDNTVKASVFHVLRANGSLSVDDYSLVDTAGANPAQSDPLPPSVLTPTSTPSSTIVPTAPFPHTHLPTVSGNLIQNPSFESNTADTPINWFTDSWGDNFPTFEYVTAGHTGTRAVSATMDAYTDGDAKWFFSPIAVSGNEDYLYSDFYMSTVKTVLIVQFTFPTGIRNYIILDVLPPQSSWTKVEQTFNIPPGVTGVSVFHTITGVGTLSLDDVSLQKLAPGSFSKGMVTLSFDDDDLSFLTGAIPPLNSAGFKASINVPTSYIGLPGKMSVFQLASLNAQGHEIESHSVTHPFLTQVSPSSAANEINSSRNALLSSHYSPATSLAYPYGDYNDSVEALVKAGGYTAARGTVPGYNTKNTDIFALHTKNITNDTPVSDAKKWIDESMANKTWLILLFHEINDGIDVYDYSSSQFKEIIDYLKSSNATVVTTNTALLQMKQ